MMAKTGNETGGGTGRPIDSEIVKAVERLLPGLDAAPLEFQKGGAHQWEGAKLANAYVCQFLQQIGLDAHFGLPFLHSSQAFKDLQNGIQPPLFRKDVKIEKFDRSGVTKFHQRWAALILDSKIKDGEPELIAARSIATACNNWPLFKNGRKIHPSTVMNWRKRLNSKRDKSWPAFENLKTAVRQEPGGRELIAKVLRDGPPGMPKLTGP